MKTWKKHWRNYLGSVKKILEWNGKSISWKIFGKFQKEFWSSKKNIPWKENFGKNLQGIFEAIPAGNLWLNSWRNPGKKWRMYSWKKKPWKSFKILEKKTLKILWRDHIILFTNNFQYSPNFWKHSWRSREKKPGGTIEKFLENPCKNSWENPRKLEESMEELLDEYLEVFLSMEKLGKWCLDKLNNPRKNSVTNQLKCFWKKSWRYSKKHPWENFLEQFSNFFPKGNIAKNPWERSWRNSSMEVFFLENPCKNC